METNSNIPDKRDQVFNETIAQVEPIYLKLVNFLQKGESVKINNEEYMGCYNSILKCSEFGEEDAERDSPIRISPRRHGGQIPEKIDVRKNERKLFDWLKKKGIEYLKFQINNLLLIKNDLDILKTLIKDFNNYLIYIHWMNKFFYFLNRFYMKNLDGKENNLYTEYHKIFREFYFDEVRHKISKICVKFISEEREEKLIPTSEVSKVISYFLLMSYESKINIKKTNENYDYEGSYPEFNGIKEPKYYKQNFEDLLKENINDFYLKILKNVWEKESTPNYVNLALKMLKEEETIAEKYYQISKKLIIGLIENLVIFDRANMICSNETSGVMVMLEKSKSDELQSLFKLLKRVPETVENLASKYCRFLELQGNQLNNDNTLIKQPLEYIKKVMTLKEENDNLVSSIFEKDLVIEKARDSAFKQFINNNEKSSRFLAMYCDNELKRGIKGLTEDEIENSLNKILSFFRFLYSRDSFLKDYTKYLSLRLLNESSCSHDAEKIMLTKLKTECGPPSVAKIMKMQEDILESKVEVDDFKKKSKIKLGYEFQMKILTGGCWPEFISTSKFIPPSEIKELVDDFNTFYKHKHNESRALNWIVSEGFAELVGSYPDSKKYQFLVSNLQMVILFELAKHTKISFENLKANTLLSDQDLIQALENLLILKIVLRKNDLTEKFAPNEVIELNLKFSHQSKRIVCNLMMRKGKPNSSIGQVGGEGEKEKESSDSAAIQQERGSLIDAAVVRVMKSRKTMRLNDLLSDTVKILHLFRPQPGQIKGRIESLIERGYMKRDDKDMTLFIYLP